MRNYQHIEFLLLYIALDYFIIFYCAKGWTCFFLFVAFTVFVAVVLFNIPKRGNNKPIKGIGDEDRMYRGSFVEAWEKCNQGESRDESKRH